MLCTRIWQRIGPAAREFGIFAAKEALCSFFPIWVLMSVFVTRHVGIPGLPRYDLILLLCVAMQFAIIAVGLETKKELAVISVFHLLGLLFELHKVALGSWHYPEFSYAAIGGVPLYSGFMYASVASYICQAWRRFDLQVEGMPSAFLSWALATLAYGYFFVRPVIDFRWLLMAAMVAIFSRTQIKFTVAVARRWMPGWTAFALIAFFVWLAENVGTYYGAWLYPDQVTGWHPVGLSKITSWTLLILVAFVIVAQLKAHERALRDKVSIPGQLPA